MAMSRKELLAVINQAAYNEVTKLDLSGKGITELPPEIGQLIKLHVLDLNNNELVNLPQQIGNLKNLLGLSVNYNQLASLPESIGQLINLVSLSASRNHLKTLPNSIGKMSSLEHVNFRCNQLITLPETICDLKKLERCYLGENRLRDIPDCFDQLANIRKISLISNQLTTLPESIGNLLSLQSLELQDNQLTILPPTLAQLENLRELDLRNNPLEPALKSAYGVGLDELRAFLASIAPQDADPLYEAKLVLVGEGGVGKTTLLKALTGAAPQEDEPTTHGVKIDVEALYLRHPEMDDVQIQFNAWDFGGQEVYKVTHQFFFSPRSIYLLVWEPRRGVQQCQVEDWLKLIHLRVGNKARVIIVSTHCKTGERIARIDRPVFREMFGDMIVGFLEVDSLEFDAETSDKYGIAVLKTLIAETAADLDHMGMPFNRNWRAARDELLELGATKPRITYNEFDAICESHGLAEIDARTLAILMHDLGYIVYYGDDERLKNDVVLQPEWLTKAIGFVLEDRITHERSGILPDSHLRKVWYNHELVNQPRYDPMFYPFFLQLMEKYDVSYRLENGTTSLVAQHVPQVRPDLPWLPSESTPAGINRIALICTLDDVPPGLVPWMIVRTHDYAYQQITDSGEVQRLHWQKGMFLHHGEHGEALLELRGREFHMYAEAVYPSYFMNVLQNTLHKLIADNWPGLEGRYAFTVPCRGQQKDQPCKGTFVIKALRTFQAQGIKEIPCQICYSTQNISQLLLGFEDKGVELHAEIAALHDHIDVRADDLHIHIEGLASRLANYVMAIMQSMANEAKHGPRLFTLEPVEQQGSILRRRPIFSNEFRLRLLCEAPDHQHTVTESGDGPGVYTFDAQAEWFQRIIPYANFLVDMLRTVLPVVGPAVEAYFGYAVDANWKNRVSMMKALADQVMPMLANYPGDHLQVGLITELERSGLLALHAFLREVDPTQANLGLKRVPTYTGDYLWLCDKHFRDQQSKIPDVIDQFDDER